MIPDDGAASTVAAAPPASDRQTDTDERADLLAFLAAQRHCIREIVKGLDEAALRQTVVPSGWTPLGMIEHLAHAERFWFQHVLTGHADELPWPSPSVDNDDMSFTSQRSVDDVLGFYDDHCARSDAVLSSMALTARPSGAVPPDMAELARNVRTVVLHMIEETARHAGHLDIARELIDGRTGLGPR
jgi:uncharacterized damage-inducible protein DinB